MSVGSWWQHFQFEANEVWPHLDMWMDDLCHSNLDKRYFFYLQQKSLLFFFFVISCFWNPHGSTTASMHLVWMEMCSLNPTVCVCFVMKCAYSSPDLLTLFCNLQAWKRSCVCVRVLYHYATLYTCLQQSAPCTPI